MWLRLAGYASLFFQAEASAGPSMKTKKKRVEHLEAQIEKRFFYVSAILPALTVVAIIFALSQK
jgi:hypothetical protein